MANNVDNVTAANPALNGAIYVAPAGTTAPTSSSTSLAAAFKALGYISEDGVSNSNSPSATPIKAWGGDTVYVTNDGRPDDWKFSPIEYLNEEVLKLIWGDDNVTGTLASEITVKTNNKPLGEHVIVIDMVHRNGVLERVVIPKGTVTAVGDLVYQSTSVTAPELTISGAPDSSGNSTYRYIKSAATT